MIVYFSGTGNSRYAASYLADKLGETLFDAVPAIRARERARMTSERPWVFVSPVYAWQLPRIFENYIRNGLFEGCKDVYFVLTCGQDIGNAGKGLAELCRMKGLNLKGVLEVVMPENYVAMFRVPDRKEAAGIIAAAHPTLERGAACIRRGENFPHRRGSPLDQVKSGIVNGAFYSFVISAKGFWTTDACNGCGLCEKLCPLENIEIVEGRPLWGKRCTHCMACICRCPKEAVEYGKRSQGKPRYRCPEYPGE